MSRRTSVFCAFCKLKYSAYTQKHIGVWTLLSCAVATAILNFWLFTDFHWAMGLVLVAIVLFAESIIRIRWRTSVCCPHCQFDPVLYKKSPDQAAAKVKSFLEYRKNDPYYLLRPTPRLPVIKVKKTDPLQGIREERRALLAKSKGTSLRV